MKKEKLSILKKKLQIEFNKFVCINDQCCVTCGSLETPQASHFFGIKSCPSLRYDLRNVHRQCFICHFIQFHNGSVLPYTRWMGQNYNMEELERDAHKPCKHDAEWYHMMLDKYRRLNEEAER